MNRKLKGAELQRLSPEELQSRGRLPVKIMLDNIRSGNNVGSVLRTSDAFRIDEVILTGITAQPPHRDILKTSLGAERSVPWEHTDDAIEFCLAAKNAGWRVAAVEQTSNSVMLEDWQPESEEKWLVVMGNEVGGVHDDLLKLADVCLEVPQFGSKHSINVAVCTGIVLWQYMIQCGLSSVRSL